MSVFSKNLRYLRESRGLKLDEFEFLEEAFKRDYALVREGETLIGDIWFEYAKKKGIPESEIPTHLDMRVN